MYGESEYSKHCAALSDLVGNDNAIKLMQEYGGKSIYIPTIKKYDKRIPLLRTIEFMREILEYNVDIDVVVYENALSNEQRQRLMSLKRYCESRHIKEFNSLISHLSLFRGEKSEKLIHLIGAAAFAALVETYSGKQLFIPYSKGAQGSFKRECSNEDCNILFALFDGMTVNEIAAKYKVSKAKVKAISENYLAGGKP